MKIFLILTMLALGAPVYAQDNTKTRFYNFDELLIDGKVKKPKVMYMDARKKVKFGRLLRLKKSFLPNLKATAKDSTLK
tara:strand:+ start:234 stop:470 length:237 start_codon:yes stop_codon:yes gene_type:complete